MTNAWMGFAAAVALCVLAGAAEAGTVTFEGHVNTIFGDEFTGNGFDVGTSDGFDFTSSGDHFHFLDSTIFGPSSGTGKLGEDRDYSISMTAAGGGSFSLLSLDFAGDDNTVPRATSLEITGFLTGGGTVTTTVNILNGTSFFSAGGATFAGFGNVTKVVFDGLGGGGGFALDNITTGAAVPLPPAAWSGLVVMAGLGLTAWVRRRRVAHFA